jgi:parallel beta-helix repeat protein
MYITASDNLRMADNKVLSSAGRGISIADQTNLVFIGNYAGLNDNIDFALDYASAGLADSQVYNNLAESNSGNGFVFLGQVKRTAINGNVARSNTQSGIDIRGAINCVLSGNVCTNNTFYGIVLRDDAAAAACTKCLIASNNCRTNVEGASSKLAPRTRTPLSATKF